MDFLKEVFCVRQSMDFPQKANVPIDFPKQEPVLGRNFP